jgi:hypothetical protein
MTTYVRMIYWPTLTSLITYLYLNTAKYWDYMFLNFAKKGRLYDIHWNESYINAYAMECLFVYPDIVFCVNLLIKHEPA